MLKITIDLFAGRPNPSWIMNDARGAEILDKISNNPEIITKTNAGYDGLGYRGVTIEILEDERDRKLPAAFSIGNGLVKNQTPSLEIVRMIVDQMERYEKFSLEVHNLTPITKDIQKVVISSIDFFEKDLARIQKYMELNRTFPSRSPIRVTVKDKECENCLYEESRFNPKFWNSDAYVRLNNNCYNYARNWRTNTFAQPGRFSGLMARSMTCAEVKAAAMRDGLVEGCNCLPQSEYPRRLMALFIAPNVDYHWYRKQKDNFWGHKPGGTPAKNIDNGGNIITDPRICDRGAGTFLDYTDFCGFFYAGKSVIIS